MAGSAAAVERANEILLAKGYAARRDLEVVAVSERLGGGKALLKGAKIVSPLSDAAETVLRIVESCVPPREELGGRMLTPRELRERLESAGA